MRVISAILMMAISSTVLAWDGYDYQRGQYVDIEKGNLVRRGKEIEVYDYSEGYKTYEVESVRGKSYGGAELELRDTSTGEIRTIDMDNQ